MDFAPDCRPDHGWCPSCQLSQQRFGFVPEDGKPVRNCVPYELVIDYVVTVRDGVAEIDDSSVIGNPGRQGGIAVQKAAHGLANYFELPLNRQSQYFVGVVCREILTGGKALYGLGAVNDFPQQLPRVMRHRAPAGSD